MVQQDVQDFEEDRVLGADTGDWPEFRDKESCQLLWNTTCDCAKLFVCANIRGLSTKVGVDRSLEQHTESWYSIFVQFSGESVSSWRLVELLAACCPLNSFRSTDLLRTGRHPPGILHKDSSTSAGRGQGGRVQPGRVRFGTDHRKLERLSVGF